MDTDQLVTELNVALGTNYDLVQRAPNSSRSAKPHGGDLVHGDLNLSNLIVRDGQIAAFVHEISPTSLPLVHQGGARILGLLQA